MSKKRSRDRRTAGPVTVPVTVRVPQETFGVLEAIRGQLGDPANQRPVAGAPATGPARIPSRSETYLWLMGLGLNVLQRMSGDPATRVPGPVTDDPEPASAPRPAPAAPLPSARQEPPGVMIIPHRAKKGVFTVDSPPPPPGAASE